jgi:hypothetical protein
MGAERARILAEFETYLDDIVVISRRTSFYDPRYEVLTYADKSLAHPHSAGPDVIGTSYTHSGQQLMFSLKAAVPYSSSAEQPIFDAPHNTSKMDGRARAIAAKFDLEFDPTIRL